MNTDSKMKKVSIKKITKSFFTTRRGKVNALKGIDFEIEAGSFFVLLGPSGCGKSTLLNIIAGIEKPTTGEINFGDLKVVSSENKIFLSPKERDVAMVFQSYALYPHLTVFDNIAFPLKISKTGKEIIKEKVSSAAEILQIQNLLDAKPGELSGGQRQRVALGRAIVRNPNVLLLDEPLSNLDALLRISMRSELKQIQRQLKTTTIYVTHDQTEAMSLGDKIAVLNEGKVVQLGNPDEIYSGPQNLFVAKFIGSPPMNLIDGNILSLLKEYYSDLQSYDAGKVKVGIRPEHIIIQNESGKKIEVEVKMIARLGSEEIVYADLNGNEILIKIHNTPNFKEGDKTNIWVDEKNILLFDKENGNRIK